MLYFSDINLAPEHLPHRSTFLTRWVCKTLQLLILGQGPGIARDLRYAPLHGRFSAQLFLKATEFTGSPPPTRYAQTTIRYSEYR